MDDAEKTPLLFADKVIHRFVDNLLGRGVSGDQSKAIRVVFRHCGGQWDQIVSGDPIHIGLLMKLVQVWGKTAPPEEKVNA
jgi:hypothetical protein